MIRIFTAAALLRMVAYMSGVKPCASLALTGAPLSSSALTATAAAPVGSQCSGVAPVCDQTKTISRQSTAQTTFFKGT